MPQTNYQKTATRTQDHDEQKTLDWLAADYVKHMKHHHNQIFEKSFDITYP
jgi:hypothetical protein